MNGAGEAVSCPWCRSVEANTWLLNNNHWPDYARREGQCIAQELTHNHVAYALSHREWDRLADYLTRAAELWSHRPDAGWLHEAQTALETARTRAEAPAHAALVDSEQGALL